MKPPIPDLILSDFEIDEEDRCTATSVKDGVYAGHTLGADDDRIATPNSRAMSVNRKLSWVHVPVWIIAEAVDICKKYPKYVVVKKRFKEHRPHKPVFSLAEMVANKYLDHIGEGLRFVQCTFPGHDAYVTITVHGGGLHRLMLDTEDHPWVSFLFELMLKENWLAECAKMMSEEEAGLAGRKRPIVTVYRDISNNSIHAGSKWSYTYG